LADGLRKVVLNDGMSGDPASWSGMPVHDIDVLLGRD
jgi:hypothetical protein